MTFNHDLFVVTAPRIYFHLLVGLLDLFTLEEPLHGGLVVDQLALEGGRLGLEDRDVLQLLQELVLVNHLQRAGSLVRAVRMQSLTTSIKNILVNLIIQVGENFN